MRKIEYPCGVLYYDMLAAVLNSGEFKRSSVTCNLETWTKLYSWEAAASDDSPAHGRETRGIEAVPASDARSRSRVLRSAA